MVEIVVAAKLRSGATERTTVEISAESCARLYRAGAETHLAETAKEIARLEAEIHSRDKEIHLIRTQWDREVREKIALGERLTDANKRISELSAFPRVSELQLYGLTEADREVITTFLIGRRVVRLPDPPSDVLPKANITHHDGHSVLTTEETEET